MYALSPQDLAAWLNDPTRPPPYLLDVREPWEFELGHLPHAENIPMGEIPQALPRLDPDQPTVVICHHGVRSAQVCLYLINQDFEAIFNLTGGVAAWSDDVDAHFPRY